MNSVWWGWGAASLAESPPPPWGWVLLHALGRARRWARTGAQLTDAESHRRVLVCGQADKGRGVGTGSPEPVLQR